MVLEFINTFDRVKHFINELSYIKYIVETFDVITIHCKTHIMIMDILTKLNTTNREQLTIMLFELQKKKKMAGIYRYQTSSSAYSYLFVTIKSIQGFCGLVTKLRV